MTARDFILVDPRLEPTLDQIRSILIGEVNFPVPPYDPKHPSAQLDLAIHEVNKTCDYDGVTIGTLDLVGHGASGLLTFGHKFSVVQEYASQQVLLSLRKHLTSDSVVRLIGCRTGLVDDGWKGGSGPALQASLANRLGVPIVATRCSVFASDFDEHGLHDFPVDGLLTFDPRSETNVFFTHPSFKDRYKGVGPLRAAEFSLVKAFVAQVHAITEVRSPFLSFLQRVLADPSLPIRCDPDLLSVPDRVFRFGPYIVTFTLSNRVAILSAPDRPRTALILPSTVRSTHVQ